MINFKKVQAHCDIPCAVYDPWPAQYATLSIIRFFDLINELTSDLENPENLAKFVRIVNQKEEHAIIVKDEISTIWGDYFKAPQIEKYPSIHDLVHSIMMDASNCKQSLDRQSGVDLLEKVNNFAEIYWETKGVSTEMKTEHYEPKLPIILPVHSD